MRNQGSCDGDGDVDNVCCCLFRCDLPWPEARQCFIGQWWSCETHRLWNVQGQYTTNSRPSLLKTILMSRLFVWRSRLSDSWIQENAMGPFERRRSNISRRRLSELPTTVFEKSADHYSLIQQPNGTWLDCFAGRAEARGQNKHILRHAQLHCSRDPSRRGLWWGNWLVKDLSSVHTLKISCHSVFRRIHITWLSFTRTKVKTDNLTSRVFDRSIPHVVHVMPLPHDHHVTFFPQASALIGGLSVFSCSRCSPVARPSTSSAARIIPTKTPKITSSKVCAPHSRTFDRFTIKMNGACVCITCERHVCEEGFRRACLHQRLRAFVFVCARVYHCRVCVWWYSRSLRARVRL